MKIVWAAILGALCATAAAHGADASSLVPTNALAAEMVQREWSGVPPPEWVVGRPTVHILPDDGVSAEARRLGDGKAEPFGVEITVSEGLVERLCGADAADASGRTGAAQIRAPQADALAGVMAHELAHVVLGHHRGLGGGRQDDVIIGWGASREAELAADRLATQIAGRGGYDPRGLVWVLQRARECLGDNSYWDSLGGEHPSYTERLAALEADRAELWRAALDFEVGVDLLGAEDFACAEMCFRDALGHFPDSPEVLCNLGYSLLMVYHRALPPEHWMRYDIGQPVPVGYVTFLPVEPRRTRGEDEMARLRALWTEAVGYLKATLQRAPGYALARREPGLRVPDRAGRA